MEKSKYQKQQQIQQICKKSLGFFINQLPLYKSNFPILENTYTLWRKYVYKLITDGLDEKNKKEAIKVFHRLSQKEYLPKFIERIKAETSSYCRGLKKVQYNLQENLDEDVKMPKKQQQLYQMLFSIGQTVWNQQLYLQLIEDLIRLPYLQIIPYKTAIIPKYQYETNCIFTNKKQGKIQKIVQKQKNNLISKILNSITQTVFSRAFVSKITTLVGTFDPLMMGASFGLSSFMSYCGKMKQNKNFQMQFQGALQFAQNKVDKLTQIYNNCCLWIQEIINTNQQQKKVEKKKLLKQAFFSVYQEQWLQIQVVKEDDWEVVTMQQKENYQEI